MSEFTFLFRGREVSPSAERMQKIMEKWQHWMNSLDASGHLKNRGLPLEYAGKVVRGIDKSVTDGPYAEAKDVVGGFMLIEADDIDHAVQLSRGCPLLESGGSVEVRPVQKLDY